MLEIDTGMNRYDQIAFKHRLEVNPLTVMDCLNITNFHIDEETKTVYLTKAGLEKVAAFFDFKLFTGVMGFKLHGWLYRGAMQ